MNRNKVLLIVEQVPYANGTGNRPVVTAIRPAPWWIRLWDFWKRTREERVPVHADLDELDALTGVYALDTNPYVLHLLMRPHRIGRGLTVTTGGSRIRMAITPTEETIMRVFRAMNVDNSTPV
jgi:hypothetical protein